ncbi:MULTISPECIES: hypothetical protein [unclassified Streptomyces]|uniref:hypothetical protein n=1 Tax=unclassified Streptomyces TaxID=2593676 RepID=UPI000371BBB0|nr:MULTISPECIES: hypothetical protein [unclassified Streptomyces]MYQ78375.1 hypothetical protein [Streptomyces sp. SID4923]
MAFVAVYDANVLYPNILRDVLIRVAGAGLVQAKWTETILDETFRNLRANAAAIRAKAQVIVTFNLKDFPAEALAPWDVEAVHPDAFLEAQIDLAPEIVYGEIQRIADSWTNPPGTVADVIERLDRNRLVSSAAALRALA